VTALWKAETRYRRRNSPEFCLTYFLFTLLGGVCGEPENSQAGNHQSADDVRSDLGKLEQGLPTKDRIFPKKKTLTSKDITVQFSLKKTFIPIFVVIAIAVIGLIIWNPWSKKTFAPIPSGTSSVAILYFENDSIICVRSLKQSLSI
jgi:hypothetical protein